MIRKFLAILIIFACTGSVAFAQMKIEVIPLDNRSADQLIPILRPLVSEGGTVTGMHNQLIIKTTPQNLEELKQVLATLDKPARRLLITVRQDVSGSQSGSSFGVEGRYRDENVNISTRDRSPGDRTGTGIAVRDADGNVIHIRGNNTNTSVADNNDFRVQTVEGQPAFIQIGSSVPVANRNAYVTRGGIVVQDTVEYHDATSGFYVIANLSGDDVTLQASPNMNRVNPGRTATFEVQNINTTVRGRLGEWIPLGGLDQSSSRQDGSTFSSTRSSNSENRSVLIKVEEI